MPPKTNDTEDAPANEPAADLTNDAPIEVAAQDPATMGLGALRAADLDPLRIWTTKGPKGVGGSLMGVFLQATNEVILLHQLDSGRYQVFRRSSVDALTDE